MSDASSFNGGSPKRSSINGTEAAGNDLANQNMIPTNEPSQRISMGTWHPKENTFALAKHNSLFIYSEKR